MPTHEQALTNLEHLIAEKHARLQTLTGLRPQSFIDEEAFEEHRRHLQDEVRRVENEMRTVLERLDRWPHRHHQRHYDRLQDFRKDGEYAESVFVMTKYPESGDPEADRLQAVIDAVVAGVLARGYRPRVALDKTHHRWMWDNIELYLLGCARGVAVVEDRYLPELNPNVAMEWGWMTGMGRDVLFLRERGFKHGRADWSGLISQDFDWHAPVPTVTEALARFLPDRTGSAGRSA